MKALAAIVLAACLMPITADAQEWKVYPYPDAGFSIQFPAPPTVDKLTSRSSAGVSLPMIRYSVRQDRIDYTLSVVDYSSTTADAMTTIAEAEKSFGASGKVTVAIDARVNRSYGRELSVTGANGSRSAVAIFFVNKHLFTLVGESLPPDAIQRSGDTVRFQESLQFTGENGGFGGFRGFGGPGGGRFRGGFNPQAQSACVGKSTGDSVQLDTPNGPVPATCTLIARPNPPPNAPNGAPGPEVPQSSAPAR
ncbi:MAG TPA: hypothetical protein VK700_03080 [Steroidobacteraceae bacterium]|jgi:hypothetical protein|nr:hypothetical protein [Steroidobacteraceae bacterium]